LRYGSPSLVCTVNPGKSGPEPIGFGLRIQQFSLCLGVIELLVLKAGTSLVAVVFDLFDRVLESRHAAGHLPVAS
jgi:hypothetical protein